MMENAGIDPATSRNLWGFDIWIKIDYKFIVIILFLSLTD